MVEKLNGANYSNEATSLSQVVRLVEQMELSMTSRAVVLQRLSRKRYSVEERIGH